MLRRIEIEVLVVEFCVMVFVLCDDVKFFDLVELNFKLLFWDIYVVVELWFGIDCIYVRWFWKEVYLLRIFIVCVKFIWWIRLNCGKLNK